MHSPVPCLPVAVIVKLSNFVCLKREESAGPINCPTTRDSDVILAGVHGVVGFVGVGVLPCRPLSLSLSPSLSLSRSLSLSPLSLVQSYRSPSPCRSEPRRAGTFSLTVDAGLRQAPLTPAPSCTERVVSVSLRLGKYGLSPPHDTICPAKGVRSVSDIGPAPTSERCPGSGASVHSLGSGPPNITLGNKNNNKNKQ